MRRPAVHPTQQLVQTELLPCSLPGVAPSSAAADKVPCKISYAAMLPGQGCGAQMFPLLWSPHPSAYFAGSRKASLCYFWGVCALLEPSRWPAVLRPLLCLGSPPVVSGAIVLEVLTQRQGHRSLLQLWRALILSTDS